ncbi:hypothetical protein [Chitiniphilus shinanonensis]|uniref:hypothetical protein n=1 Tax=Chitiniphilus shinanonensis TaxID=553088 RepID=UPI0033417CED
MTTFQELDARFGMEAPRQSQRIIRVANHPEFKETTSRSLIQGEGASVQSETITTTTNGKVHTSTYHVASGTHTSTSSAGRQARSKWIPRAARCN